MTVSDWGPDSPADDGRDAPPLPPSSAVDARTPVPADTEEQDGTEALSDDHSGSSTWAAIQALAALLEPEAFDPNVNAAPEWREPTQAVAVNHAAKVITSGYRLVSEDEATVERVARRIAEEALGRYTGDPAGLDWESMSDEDQKDFKLVARAAVRALRDGGAE